MMCVHLLLFQHVSFPQDFHSVNMAGIFLLNKTHFSKRPSTDHCEIITIKLC